MSIASSLNQRLKSVEENNLEYFDLRNLYANTASKNAEISEAHIHLLNFRYTEFRLVDIEDLVFHMPLSIAEFSRLVSESSQKAVQHLKEVWIPSCAKLISEKREDVEAWMPQDEVWFPYQ